MGVKRVVKKFFKYLIPILLILLIIPFTERTRAKEEIISPFDSTDVSCLIQLAKLDKPSNGYLIGYHYELVSKFAEYFGDTARIDLGRIEPNYLDSLVSGSLDVLVMPADRYALTDTAQVYKDSLASYSIGDTSVVWVMKGRQSFKDGFSHWLIKYKGSPEYQQDINRFFRGFNPYRKGIKKDPSVLSPYDDIIQKASKRMGWDWKMYAALIWSESKFRIEARSSRGAIGLMQMMPKTASRYDVEDILDPEENVTAGAEYIARLQNIFRSYASDKDELVKFTLAAYNAGEGRILDCIHFAASHGVSTSTWESVCTIIPLMNPESSDSLEISDLRCGPFKGNETRAYVRAVLNQYDIFKGLHPRFRIEPADTTHANDDEFTVAEEDTDFLLSPDSLSRVDSGDEEARNQEEQHNDDKSGPVSGKHSR